MANEGSTKATYSAEELKKLAETVLDKYRLEEVYSRPDQIDAAEARFYAAATPRAILDLLAELAHQRANVAEMYRDCMKAEAELARVRGLLQQDAAGRPVSELLQLAANYMNENGGGPLADCLQLKAQEIDSAFGAESADIGKLDAVDKNSETAVPPTDSVPSEQGDRVITADKSVECSSQNHTHRKWPIVRNMQEAREKAADKSGVEMGKVNRVDKMTKRCDYVSKFIPNRICTLEDGHAGAHHCVLADCGGNCGEKSCQTCNPVAGSAETGGEKAALLKRAEEWFDKQTSGYPEYADQMAELLANFVLGESGEPEKLNNAQKSGKDSQ